MTELVLQPSRKKGIEDYEVVRYTRFQDTFEPLGKIFHQPTRPKVVYNEAILNSTSVAHHKLCEGSLFLHIRVVFLHHVEDMTVVNTYYRKMSYYVCHAHDSP